MAKSKSNVNWSDYKPADWKSLPGRKWENKKTGTVISRRQYDEHYGRLVKQGYATPEAQAKSRKAQGINELPRNLRPKYRNGWQTVRPKTIDEAIDFVASLPRDSRVWLTARGRWGDRYKNLLHWATALENHLQQSVSPDMIRTALGQVHDLKGIGIWYKEPK